MKYLQTYSEQSELCNESLRDKMTPKSEDDIRNKIKNQPFYEKVLLSAEYGLLDILKDALENSGTLVDNEFINEVLKKASKKGQTDIVLYLIDKYNFDDYGKFNNLISYSVDYNHYETTKLFLERCSDKIDINWNNDWLLRVAIYRGNLDMVKLLLEHGADINKIDVKLGSFRETALNLAREKGFNDVVEYINKKRTE